MNYCGRCPSKFIIKGTFQELESFTAKKVQLIATHCTNIPIVCETATSEECTKLSKLARSLVLLVIFDGGGSNEDDVFAVATSRAMIKTIASLSVNSGSNNKSSTKCLLGRSLEEEAMIDSWMTLIWNSIDLPFQVALSLFGDENIATTAVVEKEGINADLIIALQTIETQLSKQESCLPHPKMDGPLSLAITMGSGSMDCYYTLADMSLAVTLHFMRDKNIAESALRSDKYPHLHSWMHKMHLELGLVPGRS